MAKYVQSPSYRKSEKDSILSTLVAWLLIAGIMFAVICAVVL